MAVYRDRLRVVLVLAPPISTRILDGTWHTTPLVHGSELCECPVHPAMPVAEAETRRHSFFCRWLTIRTPRQIAIRFSISRARKIARAYCTLRARTVLYALLYVYPKEVQRERILALPRLLPSRLFLPNLAGRKE